MRLKLSELAWRNLVHDKVRLLVTATSASFAVVLIAFRRSAWTPRSSRR